MPKLCDLSTNDVLFAITIPPVGEGNGTPLQYSCLENPMDGGAWWAAAHGVARSQTRLSNFTFTFHFHALEKEMATHSSVLAWRIPGKGEPGGLPSMGSHRVGHDWSVNKFVAAGGIMMTSYFINWCVIFSVADVTSSRRKGQLTTWPCSTSTFPQTWKWHYRNSFNTCMHRKASGLISKHIRRR